MNADVIRTERPATNSRLFAHTRWDALPTTAGLFHLAYFLGLFFLYPHAPLWVMLILGFIYSLMVNANINGIGHNFIHNPFFRAKTLNRLFGVTQSVACCFSQTYYETKVVTQLIGCRSIATATTGKRKILGAMFSSVSFETTSARFEESYANAAMAIYFGEISSSPHSPSPCW